jgi:hypothetical protein
MAWNAGGCGAERQYQSTTGGIGGVVCVVIVEGDAVYCLRGLRGAFAGIFRNQPVE